DDGAVVRGPRVEPELHAAPSLLPDQPAVQRERGPPGVEGVVWLPRAGVGGVVAFVSRKPPPRIALLTGQAPASSTSGRAAAVASVQSRLEGSLWSPVKNTGYPCPIRSFMSRSGSSSTEVRTSFSDASTSS